MCNKVDARKRSLCEMIGWLLSERSYQPSTGEVEVGNFENSRKKKHFLLKTLFIHVIYVNIYI